MPKKKSRLILIIIITLIVGLALCYGIVYFVDYRLQQSRETETIDTPVVDLSKFIEIQEKGYDGYGSVTARINLVHSNDYRPITYRDDAPRINSTGSNDSAETFIYQCLELRLSKTENLCNGDIISYEVVFNNLCDQLVNCEFINCEGTYVVENLTEIEAYDPFDNLSVSFDGVAPYGYVVYSVNDSYIGRSLYIPDITSGLSEGDVITFSFEPDEDKLEELKRWYGKDIATFQKEYEVMNIPQYVLCPDDLSEEGKAALLEVALEAIHNSANPDRENIEEIEYAGLIYYTIKEYSQAYTVVNKMVVIYSANQMIDDNEYTFYYPVEFNNVINNNGIIEYSSNQYVYYYSNYGEDKYTGIYNEDDLRYELIEFYQSDFDINSYDEIEDLQLQDILF